MRIRKNPKKSFLKLCKSLCVMAISEMKKQGYYKFLPLSSYLLNWSIKSWSLFHKSFDACRFWLHNNPGLKSLPCLNVITILIFNERTPPLVSILLWKKVSIISFQQSKKIFYFFDIHRNINVVDDSNGRGNRGARNRWCENLVISKKERRHRNSTEWVRKQTQESSVQKLCSTIAGALK